MLRIIYRHRYAKRLLPLALLATLWPVAADADAADSLLRGTVIGTELSVDYSTFKMSKDVNTRDMAFDGKAETFFASYERSYTWTGLDLGLPHVITKVGWMPRNDSNGPQRTLLAVFEGANRPDFMDALPLYIVTQQGTTGKMTYDSITCSMGFRYVRYVGPDNARCNIAELEFYGHQGEGDSTRLYRLTNLPVVSIHTQDGQLPYDKEHQIDCTLTIIGDSTDRVTLAEAGTIRERGNGSRQFPKRPYRIKFNTKRHILDAPAKAKKWTLLNNYGDKTLMRNLLAFRLSRLFKMPYTPYCRAVDVLLNGEYKGCYQLADQVQVHKNRVEVEEMTTQDNSGSRLTGGYLLEVDAYAYEENSMFYSSQGNPVTIQYPSEDSITQQQATYAKNAFNKMERLWSRYLDFNTFLRHFLVGEMSGNTDTYWSVFMYKHRDNDTIFTGPAWDFDLGFENDNRTYPVCNKKDYIYRSGGSTTGNMRNFVDNIVIRNADARNRLLQIWDETRQNGLTEEAFVAYIDSLEQMLQQSQRLNFMRWPIMNQYVHQNPVLWGNYTAEVQNVRRYVKERIAWMDNRLGYDHDSGIEDINIVNTIDLNQPYTVYSLGGQRLGGSIDTQPEGVYIIRQGHSTIKLTKQGARQ